MHEQRVTMILFAECNFLEQLLCPGRVQCASFSSFAFEATAHKQSNAFQHILDPVRRESNILVYESHPHLREGLKLLIIPLSLIMPIFLDYARDFMKKCL